MQLQPNRLPRGFSSLIVAVVYHPHWTGKKNDSTRDHLFQSLTAAESRYPNCALIVAFDFNRLDVKSIKKHFRLKRIVKKPTRRNAIFDVVLITLHFYYDEPLSFSPLWSLISQHCYSRAKGNGQKPLFYKNYAKAR